MCEMLGIEQPDDDESARLSDAVDHYVRARGDFFFADSADVIRTLAASYDVHMASGLVVGEGSWLGWSRVTTQAQ